MPKTIMIIAGEASGDLHGSSLASSLKTIEPNLRLIGMGGEKMIKAGVESCQNIEDLSVIGLGEVLSNLSKFKAVFRFLVGKLDSEKPECVVLIDYPVRQRGQKKKYTGHLLHKPTDLGMAKGADQDSQEGRREDDSHLRL